MIAVIESGIFDTIIPAERPGLKLCIAAGADTCFIRQSTLSWATGAPTDVYWVLSIAVAGRGHFDCDVCVCHLWFARVFSLGIP